MPLPAPAPAPLPLMAGDVTGSQAGGQEVMGSGGQVEVIEGSAGGQAAAALLLLSLAVVAAFVALRTALDGVRRSVGHGVRRSVGHGVVL